MSLISEIDELLRRANARDAEAQGKLADQSDKIDAPRVPRGRAVATTELSALRREVKAQRRLIERLARALYTHARTDLAPDAALPALRKLLSDVAQGAS